MGMFVYQFSLPVDTTWSLGIELQRDDEVVSARARLVVSSLKKPKPLLVPPKISQVDH